MRRRMVWVVVGVMAIVGASVSAAEDGALKGRRYMGEAAPLAGTAGAAPAVAEGGFVVRDFRFRGGGAMAGVWVHYRTLGKAGGGAAGGGGSRGGGLWRGWVWRGAV